MNSEQQTPATSAALFQQKQDGGTSKLPNPIKADHPCVAGKPDTPPPDKCRFCDALNYREAYYFGGKFMWQPFPALCQCATAQKDHALQQTQAQAKKEADAADKREAAERRKLERLIHSSGMGARFQLRTFDTFVETEGNAAALRSAKGFVTHFEKFLPQNGRKAENGMFITGEPGTGKTHLAAAVANDLIRQGKPVICMTMIDMLLRIRQTFKDSGAEEHEILQLYKTVPLLVIDDIGKENPTDWAISTIYSIINGRYEAMMPTIVTTNYGTAALVSRMTPEKSKDRITAAATIDRLKEMCMAVTITGDSWRGRKGRP